MLKTNKQKTQTPLQGQGTQNSQEDFDACLSLRSFGLQSPSIALPMNWHSTIESKTARKRMKSIRIARENLVGKSQWQGGVSVCVWDVSGFTHSSILRGKTRMRFEKKKKLLRKIM